MSNGSAAVVVSSFLTLVVAVSHQRRLDLARRPRSDARRSRGSRRPRRAATTSTCRRSPGSTRLAGRSTIDSGVGRMAGEDLDAGCGHVGLDEVPGRAARRECRHHVGLAVGGSSAGEGCGRTRVRGEERQKRGAVSEMDGRQPVVVGLDVGEGRVVEDHPGRAALLDVEALLDTGVDAALTRDDLAGEEAGRRRRVAQRRCCMARPTRGRSAVGRQRPR